MSIGATPTLDSYDYAGKVDLDALAESLKRCGGVILRNVANKEDLAQMEKDVRPHIEGDKVWTGSFFPAQTRRVTGLVSKSRTFVDKVIMNPVYQSTCDKFLTSYHEGHLGSEFVPCVSKPTLMNTIVFAIGPGGGDARNQPLHRDDSIYHIKHPEATAETYEYGRDVAIGFFLAGKKTTKANGATRFIPGSHLWPQSRLGGDHEADCVYAELEAGDAFMMLASAHHGGSANTTADEERLVLSCFMTKGLHRQEENQYLTHTLEQMRTLPVETARVVGYTLSTPSLGWVAFDDPIRILHPDIAPLEELY